MPRMNRILHALAASLAALIPAVTLAASPSPSPSLDQVLAPAPSGFAELTTGPLSGHFSAHDYAQNSGANNPSEIESTLNHDGFVDGFGKTWVQQSDSHALVEIVIAFTGGKGAQDWLTSAEAGDKTDPTYKHTDSITGIDHYYGVHFVSTSDNTVTDAFVFVKGNDVFAVGAASTKDDVLDLAKSQTSAQFSSAPSSTIPSSDWPENKTSSSGGAGNAIFYVIAAIVVIAVIVLAGVLRARRRSPAMAMSGATYAPPMMSGAGGPAAPPAGVQMSEDGRYWWDGQSWKDAEHEAPPSAQRSSDGMQWWDGKSWRAVPGEHTTTS
jgi:hypothetical protein